MRKCLDFGRNVAILCTHRLQSGASSILLFITRVFDFNMVVIKSITVTFFTEGIHELRSLFEFLEEI